MVLKLIEYKIYAKLRIAHILLFYAIHPYQESQTHKLLENIDVPQVTVAAGELKEVRSVARKTMTNNFVKETTTISV